MSNLEIAIRKNVEYSEVQYWLVINARNLEDVFGTTSIKEKILSRKSPICRKFVDNIRWNIFLIVTVMINTLICINYFLKDTPSQWFLAFVVVAHFTCLIYWVDFAAALSQKIIEKKNKTGSKTRGLVYLIIDSISLLPLSTAYLIIERNVHTTAYWIVRLVTLLRFYRIPVFLNQITTAGRNYWIIFIIGYIIYLILSIDIYANIYYVYYNSDVKIYGWNDTAQSKIFVLVYYSMVAFLNLGFGDFILELYWERVTTIISIFIGNIILFGIITGTLAIQLTNKQKKREIFRHEYKATKLNLKEMNIEKKVLEKISENIRATWKYKTGHLAVPLIQSLPVALQKESLFDINFGFLNRSLIFSKQPRAFLRSVVLHMKNISYLPGDIVAESSAMVEGMICVASGVIEILSEENDETALLSFTNGTILSEAALFISLPNRCVIRAATFVELQVLMKVNFARVALRYPEIYRSMQAQIYNRLSFKQEPETTVKTLDSDFYYLSRKKATKRLIQELKKHRKDETKAESSASPDSPITKLYVLSENIPRVKIFPVNLVQGRPWILRPNSFFLDVWEGFMLVVINLVVYLYPYLAAFERKISNYTYMFLFLTDVFYICDLIVQCVTAVERKDNFTYVISIRKIIQHRLTTVGFYFDVLSTYNLNIYSDLVWPEQSDFAYLLLSLNRLLKWWRMIKFFKKQENNLNRNLLLIVTVKYIYYCSVLVWWLSAVLYLEACPDKRCKENRWFAQLELQEVHDGNSDPITNWPDLVSVYWTIIILYGVGYGDIVPTAVVDCAYVMVTSVVGTCLLCLTMAHASSTFRHIARHRTFYQEEIFAVERFMEEHDLPKLVVVIVIWSLGIMGETGSLILQSTLRIKHKQAVWNYDQAFTLKHANVAEGLVGPQKTIILNQLMKKFLAVPIFQEVDDDFLRMLTKSSRICVLPPREMITEAGTFVRELYILESGYCEVSTGEETDRVRKIGPVNSFGFIEMLLGTPMEINVRTITHARIIFVDYSAYLRAITKFPAVKKQIDDILKSQYEPQSRRQWDTLGFEPLEERIVNKKIIRLQNEVFTSAILNVYKYHKNLGFEYWKPFAAWGKFRIFQFFLLPFVILPHSSFIKIWMSLRLLNVFMIGIIAPVHYSLPNSTKIWYIPMTIMLVFIYIDIYLMFHVAYYDKKGLLMYHPVKTAVYYLKGNFTVDLITAFPFHLILNAAIMDENNSFYNCLKLIIVLQFYKIWQACYYLESDIMRKTDHIRILKFIPLTFIVTNLITGLLIIVECSNYSRMSLPNNNGTTLKDQLLQGLLLYCSHGPDKRSENDDLTPFKLYIIVYYWVAYTMAQVGFGDVNDHNFHALIAVIIIVVLGVFLYACMFGSLTSVMLSIYNVITNHRKMVLEMVNFMKLEHVSEQKKKQMLLHCEYSWLRTEGATPQSMFTYVHTGLREKILAKIYGATIRQVPAFSDIDKSLIRLIGRHLHEIYFLQGETIVNYHDAQEYIYLIYRGKVNVTSNTGKFVTSLESGGLFGNISNKPFSLSSLVVTAAKNVDILKVDSEIFFKALQVFSEAKSLLDYLMAQTNDFIEPLPKAGSTTTIELETQSNRRDTIPFEITRLRRIRPELNFSSIDLTRSNKYFHFNNSIYKNPEKPFFSFVILPTSVLYKTIDICTLISAYWSFVITLYIFAFQDFSVLLLVVSYLLDLFFYIKLALQFHFSFFDKYGDLVVNKKIIRHRYFQSKISMVIDVASNTPLEIFAMVAQKSWILPSLSILRLNRLLRARYILNFYQSKIKVLMVNKIYLHLSYLIIIVSLMVHVFSCIWYFTVSPLGFVQANTWLTKMHLENAEKWEVYIVASYFTSTLFTTTGFGDIPIFSTSELIVTIIFMIVSRFALAWIAGGMACIAAAQGLSLFNYQERITELKSNFMRQKISDYQLSKMWHYVSSMWLHNAGKPVPEFITTAPYAMKCEIMSEMFGNHLSQAYPFSQTEQAFLRQLAIYLKRSVYFPGNYIVQQGDTDQTMYFIHKGQVSVLTICPDMMETIHFKLIENDHFGMIQGLVLGKPHAFSYRAETEVEILSLNLNQWSHLLRYFPNVKEKIYQRIESLPHPTRQISNMTLNN